MHPARRYLWRTAALAALLGLLYLSSATLPATADAKRGAAKVAGKGQLRGVNLTPMQAFMPGGQSDFDNQREVQSACRMGADVVRVFVMWYRLEPSRGQVNADYVAKLDSLMSQAAACGTRVMFMLAATPEWDSSAPAGTLFPTTGTYAPRDGELRWMVGWILRRWPALQSLEVWNEPNHTPYWSGTPADYAGMVNAAVAGKRDVGSRTLILAGALASGAVDYLSQLYAAGMSGQDGISVHPYSMYCVVVCLLTDPSPAQAPFRAAITRIHDVMVDRGDRSGLWLTEFGFATCPAAPTCVSEAQQASWMVKSIRIASCYPYVKGIVPFTIRDIQGDPLYAHVFDAHFGLLRTDFAPKPSYPAVASTYRRYDAAERRASTKRGRSLKVGKAAAMPGSPKCRALLGSGTAKKSAKRR